MESTKSKRKTKTDDAGLDDGRWLWKAERKGPTTRGVATSYTRTCVGSREPEEEVAFKWRSIRLSDRSVTRGCKGSFSSEAVAASPSHAIALQILLHLSHRCTVDLCEKLKEDA